MDLEFVIKANYDELVKAQERMGDLEKKYNDLLKEFQSGHIDTSQFQSFQKELVSTFNDIGDASTKVSEKFVALGNSINQGGMDTAAFERMSIVLKQIVADGDSSAEAINKLTLAANGYGAIDEAIQKQKANVQELTNDYNSQKAVIEDMKATLEEYKVVLAQAQSEGNKDLTSEMKGQIITLKSDLLEAKAELDSFAESGVQAREKLSGLESLMATLGKSVPSFSDMTAGAENAQQKIDILNSSFAAFQMSSQATSESISQLSQNSQSYSVTAKQLASAVASMTREMNNASGLEDSNNMAARFQDITQKVEEYGTAIANQTASAEMAFSQQKEYISSLEEEMAKLQALMQDAMSQKDVSSAGVIAQQMQTLSNSINDAKNQLVQFQKQAESAKESLSDVGKRQSEMLKQASRGDTFFGKIFDTYDALKERASKSFDAIKQKASEATSGIREKFGGVADSISEKFNGAIDKIGFDRLQERLAPLEDKISGALDKSKESAEAFVDAVDGMGIPLGNTINGIKGMTSAVLKFIATPFGIVLAAIALALKSVWEYLNKSAEGQKIMAKGSAMLGSIMSSITDLLVLFGKTLFKIFTSGDPLIRDFCTSLVSTFKTAFKAIRDILGGIGTLIEGTFTMDWDKVKEGFEQSGRGLLEAGEAMVSAMKTQMKSFGAAYEVIKSAFTDKELSSGITNILDNMWAKAKRAGEMSGEEMQNKVAKSEAQSDFQKTQRQISDERNKVYQLEGEEKLKQIELVKKMQKEAYEPIIATQKKELALIREKNAMHNSTLSDLAKERDLRLQVAQSEARQAASTRMMARLEASTRRSIEKKTKSDSKKKETEAKKAESSERKETNKSNAVTTAETKLSVVILQNMDAQAKETADIQNQIENARIEAMRDGYARTTAERERQNKDELLKIEDQKQKAIDAEKKRIKAEFDAENAVIKTKGGKVMAWSEDEYAKAAYKKNFDNIKAMYDELAKYVTQKQERERVDSLASEYDKRETEKRNKINQLRIDIAELEKAIANAQSTDEAQQLAKMKRRAQSQLEWLEQSKDAWNEYYTKYGTFVEKVKALDDQFEHDTIGMDQNSPEYKKKEKERDTTKQSLVLTEVKSQMNWEQVFGDLSSVSKSALAVLEEQLTTLINNSKDLSIESIKELSNALDKVREMQAKKGGLAGVVSAFGNLKSARSTAKQAQSAVENVRGGSLWRKYNTKGTSVEEKAKLKESQVYDPVTNKLTTFGKMLDKASKAAKDLSTAQKNAQSSIKGVGNDLSNLGQIGNSTSELLGKFGVNLPDGFGSAFSGLSAMGEAMESFDMTNPGSLMNINNYAKFASGMVDTFTGMFEGMANLFGASGMKEYQEAKEERDKMTALWDDLIAKKKEYLNLSYGAEAIKAANDIEGIYKADLESLDRLGRAYLKKHAGNAHSAGYRMNKDIGAEGFAEWSKVSGQNISTVQDFFDKDWTYQQLVDMKMADNGKIWAKLDTETQEYLDDLINIKKGIEDLGDTIKERLTGVSFDEFKNNFISAMKDMNSSATDMTNNFKQNLRDAIIDTMIDKKFKDRLQKLYDDFASANEDGEITKEEYDKLVAEESQLAADMQAAKQQYKEQYGWTSGETTNGSSKGFSAMTQDQAGELNGRFAAMNESMSTMNVTLSNIHANVLASLDLQNNCILELMTISRNTALSNEFLSELSDEIVRIRKKVEYL